MRCKRSKNRCSYEVRLQWEDDMRTAGKCHGRAGVGLKKDSPPGTQSEEDENDRSPLTRTRHNDHHNDGESALILTPPSSHSPPWVVTASSTPSSIATEHSYQNRYNQWKESKALSPRTTFQVLPWSIGVPDADDVCLSFYNSVMCSVAVTVDDEHNNPLRGTVMRMVFQSELAYYAVLMASAQYLRSFESRFNVMEMQVRQRVLGGLRRALTRESWDWEDVLVPTIFLCSSAISHSCDATWVRHFACFQLVIKQMVRGQRKAPVPHLFISYFSAHLVLAKSLFPIDKALPVVSVPSVSVPSTSSLPTSVEEASWTSTVALSKAMRPEKLHQIDMWNGLSNNMLLLINDILSLKHDVSELHQQQTSSEETRTAIEEKITALQKRLDATTQLLPESVRGVHESAEFAHRCRLLEYTGEAYRLAGCLLLSEASTPAFLGYTAESGKGLDSTQKQRHVDLMLSLIEAIVSSLGYLPISWPLWPLFIASCCGASESEKARALALFHAAREKAPYENTARAQTVVELLWQRRELNTEGGRMRIGQFEWEPVLEFLGWQTSFA
ncbi:hypothetical protein BO71DRAFT_406882 [Aspergillus ellipticus CBS 707.79]|uniref:C6 transcription factor n=1 Tax=Aspergillus ellipticus CBS 707.79 TaxID=1448320 RepID=A0A319DL85_9EURO|nr:hypothetical protein BO71DRAFT_406882 [Aspergillus ellipticus CBS 707.79]